MTTGSVMTTLEALSEIEDAQTWDETTTTLLDGWVKEWERTARKHAKWAQLAGALHVLLALPAVLLPVILSQTDTRTDVGYLSCSALVGVMTFLNLAAKGQQHRQAQYAYSGLRHDLIAERARPPGARRPAAFAIADFKSRAQHALMSGPAVPMACLWPFD
jgi:hypothetical protein